MVTYQIELNEKQVNYLIKALDLYTRIGLGQFEEILNWEFQWNKLSYEFSTEIRQRLDFIKCLLTGLPSSASRGIFGSDTPEGCKIAYDIQQVVRHCVAWNNKPEGDWTVDFREPMNASQEPLPQCKVSEVKK